MLSLVPNIEQECGFDSAECPIMTILFEKQEDGTVLGLIVPRSRIPSRVLVSWLNPSDCAQLPVGIRYSFSVSKGLPTYIRVGEKEYYGDEPISDPLVSSMYRSLLGKIEPLYAALQEILSGLYSADQFREKLTTVSLLHLKRLCEQGIEWSFEAGARKVKALSKNPREIRTGFIQKQLPDGTLFTLLVPDINIRDLLLVLPVTMQNPFFPTAVFLYETVASAILPDIERVQVEGLKKQIQQGIIESLLESDPTAFSEEASN